MGDTLAAGGTTGRTGFIPVPGTADGEFVSPAFLKDGAVPVRKSEKLSLPATGGKQVYHLRRTNSLSRRR